MLPRIITIIPRNLEEFANFLTVRRRSKAFKYRGYRWSGGELTFISYHPFAEPTYILSSELVVAKWIEILFSFSQAYHANNKKNSIFIRIDEMLADAHHEALLYSKKDQPVYAILNDIFNQPNGQWFLWKTNSVII